MATRWKPVGPTVLRGPWRPVVLIAAGCAWVRGYVGHGMQIEVEVLVSYDNLVQGGRYRRARVQCGVVSVRISSCSSSVSSSK